MRFIILFFIFVATGSLAASPIQSFSGLKTDIPIGDVDGTTLSINIALPEQKGAQPQPAMVYIHGGGLIKGDKSRFNKHISALAKRGIVAASVMYRLAPKNRYPAAIEDVKAAVRFLKANAETFNLDPERIIVNGASAGAYLAVMVGVIGNDDRFSDNGLYPDFDSSVRAVISQSPAIADYTLAKYHNFAIVERFKSTDIQDKQKALAALSPITYLDKSDPPFFLAHGSADEKVPVDMSREFVVELKARGHEFEYIEVEGGKHSLNASRPEKASEVSSASMRFFEKHAYSQ